MLALRMLFILSVFLISCNDNDIEVPTASTQAKFKVELSNNGIAPSVVTFINQSVNATDFIWDFGDGNSEHKVTLDTLYHTYSEAGTYNVTLTVGSKTPNLHYNKLVHTKNITINAAPVKRLYFTDRIDNKVKYIILNDNPWPILEEFESATLEKPYGMAVDTTNGKVYVTDYGKQVLNYYSWNGNSPEVLINTSNSIFNSPLGIEIVGSKIYWCQPGGILRANLNGSSPEFFVSIPGEYPQDITYDHINQTFYFTNNLNPESGGVWRVNADGSDLKIIIPHVWGAALEVDPENNRLYFYAGYEGMHTSDLNGENVRLFDSSNSGKWVWGMAIDRDGGKIYYPNRVDMNIMRANLDGSSVEVFLPATANINPNAMAIDTYR
jgi:PKD repeat protein